MKNFDRIEKYVSGELEEGDLWEFKKALEIDAQLAADLSQYIDIKAVLIETEKQSFMETLHSIHEENTQKGRQLFLKNYRIPAIAASILFLFSAGIGLLLMQSGNTRDALFEKYYTTESAAFTVRSALSGSDQPVMQGLQFYELHDYNAAIDMFEKAPNNIMGKLYSGLSYIELGEYNKAITEFKIIIEHNDNLFIDQAEWYLALSYLKTNQKKESIKHLEKIAADRSIYKTKAQKILREMENK
ncbi:MAG: hypothetical protein CVT92_03310 [Bacteroidetes bacterium HGW-Bacteroidetes-1]|jgi:tetratricopeptide (TPR) repeat protein|nr:MAG: hypothetical protein CVT92_03310 [Bacteroidetes bacterium HGW-Bacteroidetes-1]